MNIDLSIIVPTYNLEKYIKESINSIEKAISKYTYEIIVIDDFSSDNTINIVRNTFKNHRIKIIEKKKNSGVSNSRNIGIKASKGKYITFVDGDDYLEPHIYDEVLDLIIKTNKKICTFYYREILEDGTICNSKYDYSKFYKNTDCLKEYLSDHISMSVCDKVFEKKYIQKLKFKENLKYGEDVLFNIECFSKINDCVFLNRIGYNYIQRKSSAMHTYNPNLLEIIQIPCYISKETANHLEQNYYEEFEKFKIIEMFKMIHAISRCYDKKNRNIISKDLKENIDKSKLKQVVISKDFNISLRIEAFNIIVFGIKFHLFAFKYYDFFKKIIRK